MREKLIDVIKDTHAKAAWRRWGYEESADYLIENDVVPVVRCKDCRWRNEFDENGIALCWDHEQYVAENDYCSNGERITDD